MSKIHDTDIVVRYAETDAMGIVHHATYAIWFEVGRTEMIKKMGMSYSEIENKGVMLPLIHLQCNFKAPAKYEDEILVRTFVKESTATKLLFGYEVIKKSEEKILCEGETTHVWTDKTLKPVNLKKICPEIYKIWYNGFG
jgi:acyl-CoA thioester hydrolase